MADFMGILTFSIFRRRILSWILAGALLSPAFGYGGYGYPYPDTPYYTEY